ARGWSGCAGQEGLVMVVNEHDTDDELVSTAYPIVSDVLRVATGAAIRTETTWRREDLGGHLLITPIIEAITASDVVVGDISRLNFNVTYEMGYAIGLGKRTLPIVNNSLHVDLDQLQRVGIYDTLIYQTYATSQDLTDYLAGAEAGRRIATAYPVDPLPLYVVLPPAITDDAISL